MMPRNHTKSKNEMGFVTFGNLCPCRLKVFSDIFSDIPSSLPSWLFENWLDTKPEVCFTVHFCVPSEEDGSFSIIKIDKKLREIAAKKFSIVTPPEEGRTDSFEKFALRFRVNPEMPYRQLCFTWESLLKEGFKDCIPKTSFNVSQLNSDKLIGFNLIDSTINSFKIPGKEPIAVKTSDSIWKVFANTIHAVQETLLQTKLYINMLAVLPPAFPDEAIFQNLEEVAEAKKIPSHFFPTTKDEIYPYAHRMLQDIPPYFRYMFETMLIHDDMQQHMLELALRVSPMDNAAWGWHTMGTHQFYPRTNQDISFAHHMRLNFLYFLSSARLEAAYSKLCEYTLTGSITSFDTRLELPRCISARRKVHVNRKAKEDEAKIASKPDDQVTVFDLNSRSVYNDTIQGVAERAKEYAQQFQDMALKEYEMLEAEYRDLIDQEVEEFKRRLDAITVPDKKILLRPESFQKLKKMMMIVKKS